jgi:hypothetical protein
MRNRPSGNDPAWLQRMESVVPRAEQGDPRVRTIMAAVNILAIIAAIGVGAYVAWGWL